MTELSSGTFSGWISTWIMSGAHNSGEVTSLNSKVNFIAKLHIFLVYFFGLFVLAFGYMRRSIRSLRPVKVGAAMT